MFDCIVIGGGCFVRAKAKSVYHPVGTCRMGSDETSVVDPHLRVRATACAWSMRT